MIPKRAPISRLVFTPIFGGKIVRWLRSQVATQEEALAKDIAMHVAAASPEYLSPRNVPAEVIENEKEIAKGQIKGKPANIVDKIVEGKIKSFYDTSLLSTSEIYKR